MPRRLPPLANQFSGEIDKALDLVNATEHIRVQTHALPSIRNDLTTHRIELIYELAYLRIFLFWEYFLEESFVRYLCGYECAIGQQTLNSGGYHRKISDAHAAIRRGRPYVLWHDPTTVARRGNLFFLNGLHETVINSNLNRLKDFASIRHRIAHIQEDARSNFDAASMSLCGRRFRGSRPGRFLRYKAAPTERWLEVIGRELYNLAQQITP